MMEDNLKNPSLKSIADLNRVIHEPSRLMIIALLYVIESGDFTFLMQQTGLTWGNLSSHMSKLEMAGYVEVEKEFVNRKPRTMLRLTNDGRLAFQNYREQMQIFFEDFPE